MAGDAFQIEHLRALVRERRQETRFAAAGQSADESIFEPLRRRRERCDDVAPIGAIAAIELGRAPADLGQHVHERTAPLPAAPAIDERLPFTRLLRCEALDDVGDVPRDQRSTRLARVERRDLHIHRADACTLSVTEHRPVDGR